MCGLCGVLGGQAHWTDASGATGAFQDRAATHTRARERQDRTRLVNRVLRHYGLSVSDWGGASYVLRGATGKTALVDNLAQMWSMAEELTGHECDPLDEALIAALPRSGGG